MKRELRAVVGGLAAGGLMVLGLTAAADAAGSTVYVSTTGGGDCSSSASPCTLQEGVAKANGEADDTVVIAGGTYEGVSLVVTSSMTLLAAPGSAPILNGTEGTTGLLVRSGTLTMDGLTVQQSDSGLFFGEGSSGVVTHSTIAGNRLGINTAEGPGMLSVNSSTIADNAGTGLALAMNAVVTNSTISGSRTGIFDLFGLSSIEVLDSTLSGNGIAISGPSGDDLFSIGGSVLSGGSGVDCDDSALVDLGYNVESADNCRFGSTSTVGVGEAAIGLGPLAPNGSTGPLTQAIGTDSVAYQHVPVSSGLCQPTDERGVPRPGAGTTACDAGAYELHAVQTLAQVAPTTGTVMAGTAFADQLNVTGAFGAVTYTTTSGTSPVTVSSTGAVSAPASTPAGVYQLTGTDSDVLGDTGTWTYTLTVTAAGPARADLKATVTAPSQVAPGGSATIKVTVTNAGPSAATKLGTALTIPRSWTVINPGGGTVIGQQLVVFTTATLAKSASMTYTVTLKASSTKGLTLLAAGTASTTQDPNYRNNIALGIVQIR